MTAIFVVVAKVRTHKPDKMISVKDDHVIEQLPPAAAYPSLRDAILPRTAASSAAWFDTHGLDESDHLSAEDRIAVEYQVLRRRVGGEMLIIAGIPAPNQSCSRRPHSLLYPPMKQILLLLAPF